MAHSFSILYTNAYGSLYFRVREAMLWELEVSSGFIVGKDNLNNKTYAVDTALMRFTEKKLKLEWRALKTTHPRI